MPNQLGFGLPTAPPTSQTEPSPPRGAARIDGRGWVRLGTGKASMSPAVQAAVLALTTPRGSLPQKPDFGDPSLLLTKETPDIAKLVEDGARLALKELIESKSIELISVKAITGPGRLYRQVLIRDLTTGGEFDMVV